ncbi:ACT domain-containing protein [Planktotalea sp.]|uniref:ACT domain-containing protein n=1 Tax=Planktotalea sp. TaxID=2029877 RepID=UPI00344E55A5
MMGAEHDLRTLLACMSAEMIDGTFVFTTMADADVPDGVTPRMMFREGEGTTLIVLKSEAEALGLNYEFPSRMITLNIHSALDAVGFIARIATELAAAGMGVNPVAGFYHDHLFIPEDRGADAMQILQKMSVAAKNL